MKTLKIKPVFTKTLSCIFTAFILLFDTNIYAQWQTSPVSFSHENKHKLMSLESERIAENILTGSIKIPLSFELNKGQTNPEVKYLSHGKELTLFLTQPENILTLIPNQCSGKNSKAIHLKLIDWKTPSKIIEEDTLSGKVNYYIGNDPRKWQTNIPTFSKIRYKGIYTGIDLIFYGNDEELEYDFVIHPGADPREITFEFHGADKVEIDANGDLLIQTCDAQLINQAPLIYQNINGAKHFISGKFIWKEKSQLGFQTEDFDSTRLLIIDPTLRYSSYLGGSGSDHAYSIAVDFWGNVYLTGATCSGDFPTTQGAFDQTHNGNTFAGCDAFITKLNASDYSVVYSTFLGGSNGENDFPRIGGIVVDGNGNVYVTGRTASENFPTTPSSFSRTNSGVFDIFVTKLNSSGSELLYSTYIGGSNSESGMNLVRDDANNVYVVGNTGSFDFPTTDGAFDRIYNGGIRGDVFILKLNSDGSDLLYSTFLGGNGSDKGMDIALDSNDNVWVVGKTSSNNFPTTEDAFDDTFNGCGSVNCDGFISQLNINNSTLIYSTYLGGGNGDEITAIAIDRSDNIYVAGSSSSTNFPTTSWSFQPTRQSVGTNDDGFITKICGCCPSALMYSTFLGGSRAGELIEDIAVDASGNAYVTGLTASRDYPIKGKQVQDGFGGGLFDVFVTILNAKGTDLIHSVFVGGSASEHSWKLAIYKNIFWFGPPRIFVVGDAFSPDFPTTADALDNSLNGTTDAFLVVLDQELPSQEWLDPISQAQDLFISWSGKNKIEKLNQYNFKSKDFVSGDFNGDGKTDLFCTDQVNKENREWLVSYGGKSNWERLNISNLGIANLAFGDFDGDGKTDIFQFRSTRDGAEWLVSFGGKGKWEKLNTSKYGSPDLSFGDFNGDGKTDVFYANTDNEEWLISYGGKSKWVKLNTARIGLNELGFGDFNGDGKTDVFYANPGEDEWLVSFGAKGKWEKLNTSKIGLNELGFSDFDGDGKTDVFYANPAREEWLVSFGGKSKWEKLNTSKIGLADLIFGDFDGDGKTDVVFTK